MGFLSEMLSATVKTVLTPVAIAKDVVNIATSKDVDATEKLISSAVEDVEDAVGDFREGDFF
jgi:hypothetical protein